jgi:beta-N-acetylhexosaminidase/D-alanyl-D-alanine dipeptidase
MFRRLALATLAAALGCASAKAKPAPELVDVPKLAPGIRLDIRYATANNFTHQAVYPAAVCRLTRDAAERLARVQSRLEAQGLGLKVFDCYRPLSVQKKFWALVPDERYVANPAKGSRHNRACAVDLTLVDAAGRDLPMPTDFDDFSERAHRNAPASPEAAADRKKLEEAMAAEGFTGLPTEWWHFDAPGWKDSPVLDIPIENAR